VDSVLRTNSSEVVREAVLAGVGVGLRSTWDVAEALAARRLRIILPDVRGAADIGIYAVHPSPRLVSPNVRAFVRFLADLYGPMPYWDRQIGAVAA
jgi:DNA-binding transcriptional LysR family regulator